MTRKKLAAFLFALTATASLCSCGIDEPAANVDSSEDDITSVSETDEITEPEASEAESAENEQDQPAEGDEAAEIQQLVDTYFKALDEKDYETLADVTDVELMYYMENGETGTREQYIEFLKTSVDTLVSDPNMEIGAPSEANEHAGMYSDFFKMMDEEGDGELHFADTFKVDGLYTCRMKTSGEAEFSQSADEEDDSISIDFSGSGSFNFDIDFYIIRINGEWKCDPTVGTVIDMYSMFSDMSENMSTVSDDISAEAEEAE